MKDQHQSQSEVPDLEHIKFIKDRLKKTDFRAEEKLQRIDELTDIVFAARQDYKKNKTK